jgi:hypothetical protein
MRDNSENDSNLIILDRIKNLIEEGYGNVRKQVKEKMTVGEFIKMVDLYKKLAPKDSGHKEFWDMLDKIRKESMHHKKPVKSHKIKCHKPGKVESK